jgi:hypothetical protein
MAAIYHPVVRPTHVSHRTFARGGHAFAMSRHHAVGHYAVSRRYGTGVRGATVAGGVAGYGYEYPYYSSGYGYRSAGYGYAYRYRHHHSCWWYRHYDPYGMPSWCTTYEVPAYGYAYRATYGYRYRTSNHFAFTGRVHRPITVAHGVRFHGPAHGWTVAHGGTPVRSAGSGAHLHAHMRVP